MKKYIYLTPFVKEDFFVSVKKGMEDSAKMLGVSAEFDGCEGDDYEQLSAKIIKAVDDKYDGIAVNFAHPIALNKAASYAKDAGIPVIAFNIDSENAPRLSSVCQKFYPAGKGLATHIFDKIKQGSTVLTTVHDAGVSALDERLLGIKDGLRDKYLRYIDIVSENTPEQACANIMEALNENPKISVILCTGQSDTHGAALAKAKLNKGDLFIAGFDTCPEILSAIENETVYCTVDQQPYVQGYYPLLLMHQYNTVKITPFDIDTGSAIIGR